MLSAKQEFAGENMHKALVVYYSYSGATRKLAEEIASQTGADLREISPVNSYSFDYNTAAKELRNEIERGFCPSLLSGGEAIDQYDIVFIGSPNWFKRFAPPILSFIRQVDLSGKTVVPYCTSGGGGLGRMIGDYTKECPNSTILPGIAATVDFTPEEVSAWLKKIGMCG
jgi:flavodoxin